MVSIFIYLISTSMINIAICIHIQVSQRNKASVSHNHRITIITYLKISLKPYTTWSFSFRYCCACSWSTTNNLYTRVNKESLNSRNTIKLKTLIQTHESISQFRVNYTIGFSKKSFPINIDSFQNVLQIEKLIRGVKNLPLASRMVENELE